jgi:predicted Zn-dependent peptidase
MDINLPIFLAGCKSDPVPFGHGNLKHELINAISLDLLAGHSSPLFFRLYDEGLVSNDFSASFDCVTNAAYSMFGGETRDPQAVFNEVTNEIALLSKRGPDTLLFDRFKKAALGSYMRSLNSFESICSSLIDGHFHGYDAFEALNILSSITEDDITNFYRNHLISENMAISIITPK